MASLSPLLREYDQVVLDLDGCVWLGDELIDGSGEAIAALRSAGKGVAFATNNSWHSGEEQVTKLWGFGIQASLADVVTVGGALQHLLAETAYGATAFVIGTEPIRRSVADAGLKLVNGTSDADSAAVVVVGGTAEFDYPALRSAALSVRRGARFLATGRDPTLPMPEGPWPGTGSLVAAVETASGGVAEIVGKPEGRLIETAIDRLGEGRTLMVGDRLDADIAAAHAAGIDGALVRTGDGALVRTGDGASQPEPGPDDPTPVATADSLASLVGVR